MPDRNGGTLTIPGRPWHFSDDKEPREPVEDAQVPARQGEHNEEILTELGFDKSVIADLVARGALVQPSRGMTSKAG